MKAYLLLIATFTIQSFFAQSGTVKGRVSDKINNESIPFANIFIQELNKGVTSDLDGNYILNEIKPGIYNITFSFVGYDTYTASEIIVNSNKPSIINAELSESTTSLDEVEIKAFMIDGLLEFTIISEAV